MAWSDILWQYEQELIILALASQQQAAFPYDVRYLPTYAGQIAISINIPNTITHTFTYSISGTNVGTVAGPFNASFSGVSGFQTLPPVTVPVASKFYGFSIQATSPFDNTSAPFVVVPGAISVFTESTPVVTQTAPTNGALPSTLTPTFQFSFSDPDPDIWGQFGAWQLQVYRVSDSHLMWDSGMLAATSAQQSARSVSVVYGAVGGAATALSSGIQYEWRVNVQNGAGTSSGYTGYLTFTPSSGPSAPTGIHPTGLTQSLTPNVGGTYVQGIGGTESAFEYQVWQSGVLLYDSGWVTGTLAVGQAYAGTGSGALQWATAYTLQVRSKDNAGAIGAWATTTFNTDGPPNAPTAIVPSGGAVVNTTTPGISWQYNNNTSTAQSEADILLYDLTAAAWVTGYGPTPKVLSQSTNTHTVTTALTLNHQYQLQIRNTGLAAAGAGPYSAATTFTYAAAPSVAMTAPTNGASITAPSFAVTWTFSGGSGTQQDYRVQVYASDNVTVVYDSGVVAGTVLTATVPAGTVLNGGTYYVHLTVRDTLSQSAVVTPAQVTVAFTPPNTLTVTATAVGSQP